MQWRPLFHWTLYKIINFESQFSFIQFPLNKMVYMCLEARVAHKSHVRHYTIRHSDLNSSHWRSMKSRNVEKKSASLTRLGLVHFVLLNLSQIAELDYHNFELFVVIVLVLSSTSHHSLQKNMENILIIVGLLWKILNDWLLSKNIQHRYIWESSPRKAASTLADFFLSLISAF